jgi:outer membrane protein
MRGLAFSAALAVLLSGTLASGQTPTQPPPEQAQQKPPDPAPQKPPAAPPQPATQKPTTPAQPPATATPPKPFPEGAKIAWVVLQRVVNESAEGKAASAKIAALQKKKADELADKNKQLEGFQQKLQKEASVMSTTAQSDLQKQIERLQVDIQRFTQDAQQELTELQEQLRQQFEQRMTPILAQVGQEKGLHFIFNAPESGIVWADPALDISADVIKKLDASPAGGKPPVK